MFPQMSNSEFPYSNSKENYLFTSNESTNKKEDRILNRDYDDPYRFEKKISGMYPQYGGEENNKYNLNSIPLDSFKERGGATLTSNILIEDALNDNNYKRDDAISKNNLYNNYNEYNNYNYEEYNNNNKYKRRDENMSMNMNNINHSKNNSHVSNMSYSNNNNNRYKSKTNFSDDLSSNLSIGNSNNIIPDANEYKNYDNELIYYRDMIEKMHSEIGTLNLKLNDLEKNNNTSSNQKNSGCNNSTTSYTNSNLSTANFRNNKIESLEKNIDTLRDQFENNLRVKNERMIELEKERDYLIRKNERLHLGADTILKESPAQSIILEKKPSNTQVLDSRNKDIAQNLKNQNYVPYIEKSVKSVKSFITENKIERTENRKGRDFKPNNGSRVNSIERLRTPGSINKTQPSTITISNKSTSKTKKISTNNSNNSKNRKKSIKEKISHNSSHSIHSQYSQQSLQSITQQNENLNTNLVKENEELKTKISSLEKSLGRINNIDTLEKKGKDHLRVELEIWRNRSETIANSYLDTISNMKKQLAQDKTHYLEQIKGMQSSFTTQINGLKTKYQSTLDKYEINIRKLRKDNDELKKKVTKVKEILIPSK